MLSGRREKEATLFDPIAQEAPEVHPPQRQ